MRVISPKRLREFWAVHPESEGPLRAWLTVAKQTDWRNYADVKRTCANSVDQVGRCAVFDVGGNKYRLIVHINYVYSKVFILEVLTHREYDRGNWKRRCR